MAHWTERADYMSFRRIGHNESDLARIGPWDLFVSAFDESDRVRRPFDLIQAERKLWLAHEEYGVPASDVPGDCVQVSSCFDPPDVVDLARHWSRNFEGKRLCIDATGFVRPHLLVLMHALRENGFRTFDVLYSDPLRYREGELTSFTTGPVLRVEQVTGYEGSHPPLPGINDLLIVGAGYDNEQIARACQAKKNSRKFIVVGMPSLRPHMYQESKLQIDKAAEALGPLTSEQEVHAPASDPFGVAQVLRDLLTKERRTAEAKGERIGNVYLCPTGPKPHVLGFGLFYLRELEGSSASVIYPFAESYAKATTVGLRRTWEYRFEL